MKKFAKIHIKDKDLKRDDNGKFLKTKVKNDDKEEKEKYRKIVSRMGEGGK